MSIIQPTSYNNLHDYLDDLFRRRNPSKDEIAQAKKDYRLAYNARIQRERRMKNKYVSLFFTKKEYTHLLAKLSSKKSVSSQLKKIILEQDIKNKSSHNLDTANIEIQLRTIVDQLEYLEEEGQIADSRGLRNILHTLENLERKIERK